MALTSTTEESLARARDLERVRDLLEPAPVATWVSYEDRIVYVNAAGLALLGAEAPEQVVGRPPRDFIDPREHSAAGRRIDRTMRLGEPMPTAVERFRRLDGSFLAVEVTAWPIPFAGGRAIQVSLIDISQRLRAEASLRESEERHRAVTELAPHVVWMARPDGQVTYCNQFWLDYTGLTHEQTLEEGWASVIHPDDRERARDAWREALARDGGYEVEVRFRRAADGTYRWHVSRGLPLRDAAGTTEQWLGVAMDVHDRRQFEQALQESETRFRTLFEVSRDAIGISVDNALRYVNPAYAALFGYPSPQAMVGLSLYDLIAPSQLPAIRERRERRLAGLPEPTTYSVRVARANGEEFDAELRLSTLHRDGQLHMLAIVRDVTAERQAEDALRASEARFRHLANAIPSFVWVTDDDGAASYLNDAWYTYTGLSREASAGRGWTEAIHPDDRERVRAIWDEARSRQERYEAELRQRRFDGTYRWFVACAVPVRDAEGHPGRWFGTSTDIEEQKRTEHALRAANSDLEQFAFAAAHDLKEPLRMVTSYTQLLARRLGGELAPETAEYMGHVVGGAKRMQALLDDLLSYTEVSRPEEGDGGSPVDLNAAFEQAMSGLRGMVQESGAVVTREPLPTVSGRAAQFVQLFQNLVANAIKYRGDQPPVVRVWAARQGAEWHLCVRDNGMGIEPQYHRQIFGVFKRLHGKAIAGTGIGLAICQRVVERHGGRIWVESSPGEGASFCFTLPAMGGPS